MIRAGPCASVRGRYHELGLKSDITNLRILIVDGVLNALEADLDHSVRR